MEHCIKGVTEPLTRILNNNGIRATTRPVKILQQEFASPKSRPPSDRQRNVVYKIPCSDCTWNYIGETGRCLHTREKEHIRNTKVFKNGSNIVSRAWLEGHTIDFENAHVIDRGNSRVRKTLESWHTAITSHADNDSKQLPRQYSILLEYYPCYLLFIVTQVFLLFFLYLFFHSLFSHLFVYIFLPPLFTPHFLKIADWQSKAHVF